MKQIRVVPVLSMLLLFASALARADQQIAKIPVGSQPLHVAVSPDNHYVYVSNNLSGTVTVLDAFNNYALATTITVGGTNLQGIAVSPNNSKIYVVNTAANNVAVISTASWTVTSTIPVGNYPLEVAFNGSGSLAYVTNFNEDTISVINTSSGTESLPRISVNPGPRGITVLPSGRIYVANYRSDKVTAINPDRTIAAVIPTSTGSWPAFVAANPSGGKVYVTHFFGNYVSAISTASNTIIQTIGSFGAGPFGVAVSATPTGNRVFAADYYGFGSSYELTRIDPVTGTLLGAVFVGKRPAGVAASPDGTRVYAALSGENKLSVIDTTN